MKNRSVIFRFNMVEVALALVILAIGLSSVMVLFPVGLKASRASVADNNLADIAERVASYLQAKYTSREMLGSDTAFPETSGIAAFEAEPSGTVPYDPSQFTTKADGMDGLFTSGSHPGYYVYRQYSNISSGGDDSDRAVDYQMELKIADVVGDPLQILRVMLIEGDASTFDESNRIYALPEATAEAEQYLETQLARYRSYQAESFLLEDDKIFSIDIKDMEQGAVQKYTVVVWIEGCDIDCTNDHLGDRIKMELDIIGQ